MTGPISHHLMRARELLHEYPDRRGVELARVHLDAAIRAVRQAHRDNR